MMFYIAYTFFPHTVLIHHNQYMFSRIVYRYTLREPPDDTWGSFEDGKWQGLPAEMYYKVQNITLNVHTLRGQIYEK